MQEVIAQQTPPTFVDYLRSGWQMGMAVAIDYTGSNNDPDDPNSLHWTGGPGQNQYQSAINQVGAVLEPYDSDKQFPVFGFGGKPEFMGAKVVSHCFPLTGSPQQPYVTGV